MSQEQLKQEVDTYVDEVWEDLLADIDRLIRIDSVEDKPHAAPGAPWGPAPAEALSTALQIAEKLGLEPHNLDGYIGYGCLTGESTQTLATIAHCDIVPTGDGWTYDPLRLSREGGYLIGRGVQDDKGPLVLSLYAASFFARRAAQSGTTLPYTLHAIIGANEETNMGDVDYYLNACGQPAFLFTPDADFPLICGEKGIFQGMFTSERVSGTSELVSIKGGTAANAVPGSAKALVKTNPSALPAAEHIELESSADGLVCITAHGKGGHASIPEGTVNAIALLAAYLLKHVQLTDVERSFLELSLRLCSSSDGSAANMTCSDDVFGPLTCIGGTIKYENGILYQSVDSRYPTTITEAGVIDALSRLGAGYGASFEALANKDPFYTDPTSAPIQALLATYNEYSEVEGKPYVIGGGTYARHFARACAFGPNDETFPRPAGIGIEHGPNEGIREDLMRRALKIYIVALARLMELDF